MVILHHITHMEFEEDLPRSFKMGVGRQVKRFWWGDLPRLILEEIFAYLSPHDRARAAEVCWNWYGAFYTPSLWEELVVHDRMFRSVDRMWNHQARPGVPNVIHYRVAPEKIRMCLYRVGHYFKSIRIVPMADYFSLYEFLRGLASFLQDFPTYPLPLLHSFHLKYACETRQGSGGVMIHGTGGTILDELERVLRSLQRITSLSLYNLLLKSTDAAELLLYTFDNLVEYIKELHVVNCCNRTYVFADVALFGGLRRLVISPQHINDPLIEILAASGLESLCLYEDQYTSDAVVISALVWYEIRRNTRLRVTLQSADRSLSHVTMQPEAPAVACLYQTPYLSLGARLATDLSTLYGSTLEAFVQTGIPRRQGSRKFPDRCDSPLLELVKHCSRLTCLVVRERISTGTLLLLASQAPHLKRLLVRQNALLRQLSWTRAADWSDSFYRWLTVACRSYERTNLEVAKLLGQPHWRPLTDKEFKNIDFGNFL